MEKGGNGLDPATSTDVKVADAKVKNTTVMPKAAKTPARMSTAVALIEAAEYLFAKHGIEGASLREIAVAAGSSNSFAVQYHFGGREALAQAICDHRQEAFEARRAELLEQPNDEPGQRSLSVILEAICRPLFEQYDREGRHSYANFLSSLRRSSAGDGWLGGDPPVRTALIVRLREALPQLDDDEFHRRYTLGFGMLLDAIQWHDRGMPGFQNAEAVLEEVLRVLKAIFEAPARAIPRRRGGGR